MIGRLSGKLAVRGADHVMIDVAGVGYLVHCSERTLAGLPPRGAFVSLYTELLVREDLLQLMGFETLAEKEWFRLLTGVQGVGARAALAILGTLGADGMSRAMALSDAAAVRAAPGVGPKLAQRVVNELRDRAPAVMALAGRVDGPDPAVPVEGLAAMTGDPRREESPPVASNGLGAQSDALSALTNLGYPPADAAGAVATAAAEAPDAGPETLIRAALRALAPST